MSNWGLLVSILGCRNGSIDAWVVCGLAGDLQIDGLRDTYADGWMDG